jgi:hypothetical protein
MASRSTLESDADPSHPGITKINFISLEHTPRTLVDISPFLLRYRGLSIAGTLTWICVPSSAPRQFYKKKYQNKHS